MSPSETISPTAHYTGYVWARKRARLAAELADPRASDSASRLAHILEAWTQ
jgi:hypothetical protein